MPSQIDGFHLGVTYADTGSVGFTCQTGTHLQTSFGHRGADKP